MAIERFEVRVPEEEAGHYHDWQAAAKRAGQSLRVWVIAACNAALAPPRSAAKPEAPRTPAPGRIAAPGVPLDRDAWWTAGLWAGRIERVFDADLPEALSWTDLRRWAADHPAAAQRLDAWAGQQAWGSRWAAVWRSH